MDFAQNQDVAGLGDVLGRGAPMDPASVRLADDASQFDDQRHQRMTCQCDPIPDAIEIQAIDSAGGRYRLGRVPWNDAKIGLSQGEGRFDLKPRLPALLRPEQSV